MSNEYKTHKSTLTHSHRKRRSTNGGKCAGDAGVCVSVCLCVCVCELNVQQTVEEHRSQCEMKDVRKKKV